MTAFDRYQRARRDYDGIAAHFELSCEVDRIVKDWGNRAVKKARIRAAWEAAIDRAPSKAAGRRALGPVSHWYDSL